MGACDRFHFVFEVSTYLHYHRSAGSWKVKVMQVPSISHARTQRCVKIGTRENKIQSRKSQINLRLKFGACSGWNEKKKKPFCFASRHVFVLRCSNAPPILLLSFSGSVCECLCRVCIYYLATHQMYTYKPIWHFKPITWGIYPFPKWNDTTNHV